MSVLVRGMEMPDSCIACRFGKETNYAGDFEEKCLVNGKCGYVSVRKPRLDTCPLVEVPTPHGRLKDADAFDERVRVAGGMSEEELTEDFKDGVQTVLYMLSKQPPVIEAEGSENENNNV